MLAGAQECVPSATASSVAVTVTVCGVVSDAAPSDDVVRPAPTSRSRSAKARAALETPLTVFGLARSFSAA